jgi:hypothetical protein
LDSKIINKELNFSMMAEGGGCFIEINKKIGMGVFTTVEHNMYDWKKVF